MTIFDAFSIHICVTQRQHSVSFTFSTHNIDYYMWLWVWEVVAHTSTPDMSVIAFMEAHIRWKKKRHISFSSRMSICGFPIHRTYNIRKDEQKQPYEGKIHILIQFDSKVSFNSHKRYDRINDEFFNPNNQLARGQSYSKDIRKCKTKNYTEAKETPTNIFCSTYTHRSLSLSFLSLLNVCLLCVCTAPMCVPYVRVYCGAMCVWAHRYTASTYSYECECMGEYLGIMGSSCVFIRYKWYFKYAGHIVHTHIRSTHTIWSNVIIWWWWYRKYKERRRRTKL